MPPGKSSSSPGQRNDKEIDALLSRLHSGCRFVDYEDSSSRRKGSDGISRVVCNLLRNSSPPDETHAELGRALAHSYVVSLHSISYEFQSSGKDENVKGAIERGERILQSLCCGEKLANDDDDGGSTAHSERANYASAGYAFFGHLRSFFLSNEEIGTPVKGFIQSQWKNWCIRCEEFASPMGGMPSECNGGGIHVLNACLKNYGKICYLVGKDGSNTQDGCASVYESLKHHSSRKYLIRTFVAHVFSLMASDNTDFTIDPVDSISPLFQSCVLSARRTTKQTCYHAERQLIFQEVMGGCSTLLFHVMAINGDESHADEKITLISNTANMIQYLTISLTSYLNQGIHASFSKVNGDTECLDIFELGYDWLRGICELMTKLTSIDESNISKNALYASIEIITTTVLPQFTPSSNASISTTFDMSPIYSSLVSCINSLPQHKLLPMANATIALRLGSLLLTLQDDAEVQLMCDLILATLKDQTRDNSNVFTGGMLIALGCVFRCRPTCFKSATGLVQLGEALLQKAQYQKHEENSDGRHLMDIIMYSLDSDCFQSLMDIILISVSDTESPSTPSLNLWHRRPLSLPNQCTGLLLGLSLLHISISSSQSIMEPDRALAFLGSFLECYPRMASRVAPSIVDITRTLIAKQSHNSQPLLLAPLEFLASPYIVSDPHGAHLAWSFLSSLVKEGVPTAVRSAVIRQLPDMCSSNKKLFRRIRDVIGKSMVAQDPIIRVSATAALSYMANLDLLRDVEQIVGWIQNRLTDDEPAVVYYSLETLRYLVVHEELEFDLVIRVLEKRLGVDLSNVDVVLSLDTLALEGLLALMGEGGLEEEGDDDDESDDEDEGGPVVSPQSIKAVTLLVELALSSRLSVKDGIRQDKDTEFLSKARVQREIYGSLAGYSSQELGLDAEGVRSWGGAGDSAEDLEDKNPEIERYLCLKEIVLTGLKVATQLHTMTSSIGEVGEVEEIATGVLESATEISKTLLQFEESCHGSFLFRGGNSAGRGSSEKSPKGKADSRTRVSKSVLSSLPSASSIKDMFESDPRSASATAVMYSIGSSESDSNAFLQTEDILESMAECFGDIENEPLDDPSFQAVQICSLLMLMENIWKSIEDADQSVREELLDQVVAQIEEWSATYGGEYAYVAMAAFALSVNDSAQCWTGVTKIHSAILEGHYLFESEDTKILCLSMIAARLSRSADARVTGLIDTIEQSFSDHTRQTCFGAFFGLGVIVTNLMRGNINGTDPSDSWRRQQAQRIVCMFLSAFNTCLAQDNDAVLELISSIKDGRATNDLSESCSNLDFMIVRDGSAQKMKAIMIGLSYTMPVLSVISSSLLKCVIGILGKLPWGSGKGFLLHATYKNAVDSGVLEQKDVSAEISTISSYIQGASSNVGDALLYLASLCRLSSVKVQQELDLVAETCHKVLLGRDAQVNGDDKMMSILAGCAAIGELPGGASFTPTIHGAVKKKFVSDIVKTLEEIALNDSEELKYRDASTIGLGILCAMSRSSHRRNETRRNAANKFESIQAKEGSIMQSVFEEVEASYSLLCTEPSIHDTRRVAVVNKLCALFSALEPIALPGSFSRVIELTLNDSSSNELELKTSSIKLLASQLESRRRIGFDGRGFVDLFTRLAKMPSNELHSLVGAKAIPIMMKSFPNLIYQIPTSIGGEMAMSLWTICRANLKSSSSTQCTTEFLLGLKSILISVNSEGKPGSKQSISPALLRTFQKSIVTEIFFDLCTDAVPSNEMNTQTIWASYLQCLNLVPSGAVAETFGPNCDISNVFGMAVCASSTRKVEPWIARQSWTSLENRQILLLSILVMAAHARSDNEMKESVLSIFEVMVVKGIDTMALYLLAAKIAFWWESRHVAHQLQYIDMPMQQISNISSFFVTRNLGFNVYVLSPKLLTKLFDSFVDDLPSKIAVLCKMWKISDDVSNRASRVWNAYLQKEEDIIGHLPHSGKRSLSCVRDIVQSIGGGEI